MICIGIGKPATRRIFASSRDLLGESRSTAKSVPSAIFWLYDFPVLRNKIARDRTPVSFMGNLRPRDVLYCEPSQTDICPIYSAPLLKAEAERSAINVSRRALPQPRRITRCSGSCSLPFVQTAAYYVHSKRYIHVIDIYFAATNLQFSSTYLFWSDSPTCYIRRGGLYYDKVQYKYPSDVKLKYWYFFMRARVPSTLGSTSPVLDSFEDFSTHAECQRTRYTLRKRLTAAF